MVDPDNTGDQQAAAPAGQRGRFQPGVSGNPAGRPKNSRNATTALCADLLSVDAEALMGRLIEQAKTGEGVALRLCIERLIPAKAARDRVVELELPDVAAIGDLVQASAAVIDHASHGRITLSEAKEYMGLLEVQRKLVETAALSVRIEALEAHHAGEAKVMEGLSGLAPDLRSRVRLLDRPEVLR